MVKKRRENAAGATARGETSATPDYKYNIRMAPLEFIRQQLVKSKSAIIELNLPRIHIYKNELTGLEVDRYGVVTMYLNTKSVFIRDDPKREEIMDQASDLSKLRAK